MRLSLLPLLFAVWSGAAQACEVSTDVTFYDIIRMEQAIEGRVIGYELRGERAFLTLATDLGPVEVPFLALQYGPADRWYGPDEGIFVLRRHKGQLGVVEGVCSWGPTILPRTAEGRAFIAYFSTDEELSLALARAAQANPQSSGLVMSDEAFMADLVAWHACEQGGDAVCARPVWTNEVNQ